MIAYGDRKGDASWEGADALHGAISIGATGLVKWLLDNGASPNTKTKQGMTPLQRASGRGPDSDIVALLRGAAQRRGIALDEGGRRE